MHFPAHRASHTGESVAHDFASCPKGVVSRKPTSLLLPFRTAGGGTPRRRIPRTEDILRRRHHSSRRARVLIRLSECIFRLFSRLERSISIICSWQRGRATTTWKTRRRLCPHITSAYPNAFDCLCFTGSDAESGCR
eukprot:scaffold219399_cov28-Tisochrysis_lutea.AAC.1